MKLCKPSRNDEKPPPYHATSCLERRIDAYLDDKPDPRLLLRSKATAMIQPMLAFDAKGDMTQIPRDGTWVMEPKFDGIRFQLEVLMSEPGYPNWVKATGGRNGSDHTGRHPTIEALIAEAAPPDTILDGELVQIDGLTHLIVFDCLKYNGEDITGWSWLSRRYYVESIAFAVPGPLVTCPPAGEVSDETYEAWVAMGMEGAVCKRKAGTYRPGKRSRDWMKIKAEETTDAIVIGWKFGKGKNNQTRCGALQVTLVETGVDTTCGFDVPTTKADEMLGRRIELHHSGFQKSGKVRHPRYGRLREDLEAAR